MPYTKAGREAAERAGYRMDPDEPERVRGLRTRSEIEEQLRTQARRLFPGQRDAVREYLRTREGQALLRRLERAPESLSKGVAMTREDLVITIMAKAAAMFPGLDPNEALRRYLATPEGKADSTAYYNAFPLPTRTPTLEEGLPGGTAIVTDERTGPVDLVSVTPSHANDWTQPAAPGAGRSVTSDKLTPDQRRVVEETPPQFRRVGTEKADQLAKHFREHPEEYRQHRAAALVESGGVTARSRQQIAKDIELAEFAMDRALEPLVARLAHDPGVTSHQALERVFRHVPGAYAVYRKAMNGALGGNLGAGLVGVERFSKMVAVLAEEMDGPHVLKRALGGTYFQALETVLTSTTPAAILKRVEREEAEAERERAIQKDDEEGGGDDDGGNDFDATCKRCGAGMYKVQATCLHCGKGHRGRAKRTARKLRRAFKRSAG
jgi:hypothetical protein